MADYSPYEILGIAKDATDEEIRTAYRRAVRTAHPDAGGTPGMFGLVREAYDLLRDPARRADFDNGRRSSDIEEADTDPGWGVAVDPDAVVDDVTPAPTSPADAEREPFGWRFGRFLVRLGAAIVAAGLGWFLARPAFGGSYRPDAAGADLLGWAERFNLPAAAVIVYLICIVTSMVGFYYQGLAALTVAAFAGLISWPFAYWGLATVAERWQWIGWLAGFVAYQLVLVGLMSKRWTNATAERAAGEYD